jgi:MFS family permease
MARPYRKSLTSLAELVDDPGNVGRWLYRAGPTVQLAFGGIAGFVTCLGAFALRDPFLAAPLAGELSLFGTAPVPLRGVCVAAQALGLAMSQPLGAVAVVELDPGRRVPALAAVLGIAELGLVAFALLPNTLAPICLFVNGLALGLVWGLVFGFLEGRRISDGLGAAAAAGYLLAGGLMQRLGGVLLSAGVPAAWTPAAAGVVAAGPLALSLWMLAQFPPPNRQDEAERFFRAPMTAVMRRQFLRASLAGLAMLVVAHAVLSGYRELRVAITMDLWGVYTEPDAPSVLTAAELPVAVLTVVAVGALMVFRDHRRALVAVHGLVLLGLGLIGGATGAYLNGALAPETWMVLVGAGLFVVHVPFTCVLFDRMVAAVGLVGTAVYMVFVAGAFGQVGRLVVVAIELWHGPLITSLADFAWASIVVTVVAAVLVVGSAAYFRTHRRDAMTVTGGI